MRRISYLLVVIFTVSLISCSSLTDPEYELEPESYTQPSPDSRFTGTWTGSYYGIWLSSIMEYKSYRSYYWSFKDDNTIYYASRVKKYGIETDYYQFTYEWKLENGVYYYKLYDNRFSDWEVFDIEYIDENNIIIRGTELTRYK